VFTQHATLEGLAGRLNMDATELRASVDEYNSRERGAGQGRGGLTDGPYVALGPVRAVFVHSEGGLAVDESHRVLDRAERAVPGLYAAGSTGQGGLLLKGHGHHLAWAFVSGRRAGRIAAQEARSG
jgi:succinate dehydrogenase/fumarate reductase flavoprotein subunit